MAVVTECQRWLKIHLAHLPSLPASPAAIYLRNIIVIGPGFFFEGRRIKGGREERCTFFPQAAPGRSRGAVLSDLIDVALGDLNPLM